MTDNRNDIDRMLWKIAGAPEEVLDEVYGVNMPMLDEDIGIRQLGPVDDLGGRWELGLLDETQDAFSFGMTAEIAVHERTDGTWRVTVTFPAIGSHDARTAFARAAVYQAAARLAAEIEREIGNAPAAAISPTDLRIARFIDRTISII